MSRPQEHDPMRDCLPYRKGWNRAEQMLADADLATLQAAWRNIDDATKGLPVTSPVYLELTGGGAYVLERLKDQ